MRVARDERCMLNKSIIGLHAEFAGADNIDKFERFIFQGQASGDFRLQTLEQDCVDCALQLASQQGLSLHDLPVVLLTETLSTTQKAVLSKHFAALYVVGNLAAVEPYWQQHELLALIAISQGEDNCLPSKNTISLDESFDAYINNSGVAGILLADKAYCESHQLYRYADVLGYQSGEQLNEVAKKALMQAQKNASDIGYIECTAHANNQLLELERQALLNAYAGDKTLHTALGSIGSIIGEPSCFAQLAGLIKTVLVLHQRYLPAVKDWQKSADDSLQHSPFFIPVEASHWFSQHAANAAYSCQTQDSYSHWVLQENVEDKNRSNGYLACSDLVLIPLAAQNQYGLLKALEELKQQLHHNSLRTLARSSFQTFNQQQSDYRLCLLAENEEELLKEIALAEQGVAKAFAERGEWKTPKGSYFSAVPMNDNNGISFLYPGIGATYVGLGRELFHLFPEIIAPVTQLADNIAESLKDNILNPRSVNRLGFHELKAIDHQLRNSLADIAECGVGFACIFTKIFEDVFKLKADFSTGYSMGEISMYAALGCWEKPGQMSKRLAESDTFNHHLTGELQTLRKHWGLPPAEHGQIEQLWETYTLKATLEEIQQAAANEDKVYCTIINTPDSLVIGGDPEACQRVIKKIGVRGMALDMPNAIHSPPAQLEYKNMEALYTMDVTQRVDAKLYSSSCYLPVPQRTKAIANSIAKCLCDPVDFPRLVNAMYDKGARVFIEMGPGRSLCSWVEKILKHEADKPHVSVPVNAKGTSDELTILRALAKLVSHGVELDLSRLYDGSLLKSPATYNGQEGAA